MAVRLEGTIKRFLGDSSDRKPVPGQIGLQDGYVLKDSDLPVGSSFLETDTWRIARWDGTRWTYPDDAGALAERVGELLAEAQRTNELLELLVEKI